MSNNYLNAGSTYYLRIDIPEDISEADRKKAEYRILSSILDQKEEVRRGALLQGVDVKAIYRQGYSTSDVERDAKIALLNTLKEAVNSIKITEMVTGELVLS